MPHPPKDPPERSPFRKEWREKHPLFDIGPGRLLGIVLLVLFFAESGEWLIKVHISPETPVSEIFIDMLSMMVILVPAYYFFYRPFQAQWHGRQLLEEELRKSEERLRLALEGTRSGLWDLDLTTGKAYYSQSGGNILGYTEAEMEPSVETWKSLLHPEDYPRVMEAMNNNLEGHSSLYETDHRLYSKSGEWIWFHAIGQVTARDSNGKALRMVGTFHDVTDRKEAEEQIHRLWQHLDRATETERIRIAQDLHDQFGQLVTALQLELGLFKHPLPEEEHAAKCRRLIDLATQLGHLIRDVTSRLRPPALDTGLVPAIEYNIERMKEHVDDLRLSLHAPDLERMRLNTGIEIALFRIYQEALSNAIKHARAQKVDINLQREGDEITLTVQDDGVGFQPKPENAMVTPSGLGLAGMRERVSALGGRLEIISAPGSGTTIRARLPWRPRKTEKAA